MPALQDFARLVFFSKEVAEATTAVSIEHRNECSEKIETFMRDARNGLGRGLHPGQLVANAARAALRDLAEPVVSTLEELRRKMLDIPTGGYGVLRAFQSGVLLDAVVVACIDEINEEPSWRDAMRFAVYKASSSGDASEDLWKLRLVIIAAACKSGTLMADLRALNLDTDADLMTMYGAYVTSSHVSARGVLGCVMKTRIQSTSLRRIALEAVMWNLIALDQNTSVPDVAMVHRVSTNMRHAGVSPVTVYQSLRSVVPEAERSFRLELQSARADAARLLRRKGSIYVTRLRLRQIAAWAYIVATIVVAILCAVLNWNGRDQLFDRAKDAFEILTIFLVSVFGLIKLTSEDPNALKNLAAGKSLVHDLADVSKILPSSPESLQKLLCIESEEADWAAADGCTFGRAVSGDGLDVGPAHVTTLKRCGFFILEDICKRPYFWENAVTINNVKLAVAKLGGSKKLRLSTAPHFVEIG